MLELGEQHTEKLMSKLVYTGKEGVGKSLKIAILVPELVQRNWKWKEQTGLVRPIWSNMKFSEEFYKYATEEKGIPIFYWENLDDLIKIENADVICDEVGNYFDSRMWADLSLDVRRWLTQGSKMGIEFYGTAQDFAQVDKSFRRLCNHLYIIKKLAGSARPSATRPPVKRIWGICLMSELDPNAYDEDKKKFASGGIIPSFFFIRKETCEIFDTSQKITRSKLPPYKHEERYCENPGCVDRYGKPFKHIIHA